MDIEKLIERLRNNNIDNNCHDCALGYCAFEAAESLSTLQAENEKLRKELEWKDMVIKLVKRKDREVKAELVRVKRERDAAVSDLETVMAYGDGNLDTCTFCKNGQCYERGGTKLCNPEWRGQKED